MIRCSTSQIGEVFPQVIWHTERPVLRTAPAPLYLLSRLVHDAELVPENLDSISNLLRFIASKREMSQASS